MRGTGATEWWRARRGALIGCALAGLIAFASPAAAQSDDGGPLRFLKPWIERQLFGRETSEPDPALPTAPAPTDGAVPPDMTNPGPAPPPAGAPAEPAPEDGTTTMPTPEGGAEPQDPPSSNLTVGAEGQSPEATDADRLEELAAPPTDPVEAKPEPLRFGVLAGRSLAATMAAVGPVADELQAMLGRPVEILPLASYTAMVDAQAQRRIDGGFYSAAAFAAADAICACIEPLVAPRAPDGTLAYHAVIVARAGSGIASVVDLAGKTVAIGASDSIGARRMQLAGLLAEGVDPATTFGAVLEVESAEAAVRLVATGSADAAFAWSSLAGRVDDGYSRGTLSDLVANGEIAMDAFAVVWSSPPIAHGPFAVMRTLAESDKQQIERYLVALSGANPAAYDMLDPLYGGGYAPVDPQDYRGLETLLAENVDALRLPGSPETTGATTAVPSDAPPAPN